MDLMSLDRSKWCTPLPQWDPSGGRIIVTSPEGPRGGGVHYGTDMGSTDGLDLYTSTHAMAAGVVELVGNALPNAAGLFAWLRTDEFLAGFQIGLKYFHLAEHVSRTGDRVGKGEVIAKAGGTGGFAVHTHLQLHLLDGRPDEWSDRTAVYNTDFIQKLIDEGRFPGAVEVTPPPHPKPVMPKPQEPDMLANQPAYAFGEKDHPWSGLTYWADNNGNLHHVPGPTELARMSAPNQGHPPILQPLHWLERDDFCNQLAAYDEDLANAVRALLAEAA